MGEFCNILINSATSDAFTEVMKVTNHIALYDAELTWYSPSAIQQFYLYSLEYSQGMCAFMPIWLCGSSMFFPCPRGVMVKAMNCGIVVSEFVLQSRYYVHFRANTLGKGMNPLILPAIG